MEYKLAKTNHTITATNPDLLTTYMDQETLLNKINSMTFDPTNPEITLADLTNSHKHITVSKEETESGTRIRIARVREYGQRRTSSAGLVKAKKPRKKGKFQGIMNDKKNPFGRFMKREFKKDKLSGNVCHEFKGFGPRKVRPMKKNKSTSRLNAMRKYKELKKQKSNNFKLTQVPSDWNEDVKVLPHESLPSFGKSNKKRFY